MCAWGRVGPAGHGCGALFLLRGSPPACKKQTAALLRFGCLVRWTRLSFGSPHAWEAGLIGYI